MIKLLVMLQWFAREAETLHSLNPISASLVLLASILFLLKIGESWSSKLNLPPSPWTLPLVGNLHQLVGVAHRCFRDLSNKYGPIMLLHLGYSPTLIVSSSIIAREIMKTQDNIFAKRPQVTAAQAILYKCNDMVFTSDAEFHKKVRKFCMQELLSNNRVQSFKYIREEEVSLMIKKISRSWSSQNPVNISEMAITLTNNITCRCAFSTKSEDVNGISEMAREVSTLFGKLSFADLYPSLGWMDVLTGLRSRLRKASHKFDTYLEKVMKEHIAKREMDDSKKDLLDLLLHVQADNNFTLENIKGILLDMFLAGTDTSAVTIEWTMAELIKKPKVLKKAQEEVRRIVGTASNLQEAHIHQMEYLKCVVKEILRMHPAIPMTLPRVATMSTKINGYDIPLNTIVMINAWAIQRDSEVWDNPDEFIPERFSNSTMDFRGQSYEFIPFGSGRRGCPGISFALAMVEVIVANLLYYYNWELPAGIRANELDMMEGFGMGANRRTPLHLVPMSFFS